MDETCLKMVTEHDVIKAFSYVVDKTKAKKLSEFDDGKFIDLLHITKSRIEFVSPYYFIFYNFSDVEKTINEELGLFEIAEDYYVRLLDFVTVKKGTDFENRFFKSRLTHFPKIQKLLDEVNNDGTRARFLLDYLLNYFKFCNALKSKDKSIEISLAAGTKPSKFKFKQTEFYLMPVYEKGGENVTAGNDI